MLRRMLIYAAAALLFLLGMRWEATAQAHERAQAGVQLETAVPVNHSARPADRFAPTLPAEDFPGNPVAQNAYATAAKIEPLLNQLPCDCGHVKPSSQPNLLGCFQDRQASRSLACQEEDYYAYQKSRDGSSVRQIRKGILRGAWKSVNLSSWKRTQMLKTTSAG